jgi:very-short-patch-repair endonuclease
MTHAEKLLWDQLKNRKINGLRFRRQHPIDDFIVDFFCQEARLVIELDGGIHDSQAQRERDIERTKILNEHGLQVVRFLNEDVEQNIMEVISRIRENTNIVK